MGPGCASEKDGFVGAGGVWAAGGGGAGAGAGPVVFLCFLVFALAGFFVFALAGFLEALTLA